MSENYRKLLDLEHVLNSPDMYLGELVNKEKQALLYDIYDGDIIRSNYKYAQPKVSLVIREDGNSYIVGEDMATGNEMLVSDHVNEIEVIGNVYDNAELLGEE